MKHGEFVSHWCESYEEMHQYMDKQLEGMDCVTTSQLSEQHAFPAISRVSDSPLRSPLWLHVVSVVSNKEEILVPSWPAHRGHRKIYGVCLLHRGCFWTEPDINNTSPVHQSSIGSSFMLWSSDFIECKMWLHGVVFHIIQSGNKKAWSLKIFYIASLWHNIFI